MLKLLSNIQNNISVLIIVIDNVILLFLCKAFLTIMDVVFTENMEVQSNGIQATFMNKLILQENNCVCFSSIKNYVPSYQHLYSPDLAGKVTESYKA